MGATLNGESLDFRSIVFFVDTSLDFIRSQAKHFTYCVKVYLQRLVRSTPILGVICFYGVFQYKVCIDLRLTDTILYSLTLYLCHFLIGKDVK